ncbi:MAG: sigma-70 family RNA polymerase sigma factor [Prolixibacteraceae bacterium]
MSEDSHIWEKFKNAEDSALSMIYSQHVDFLFGYGRKFSDDEDFIFDTIQDLFYYLITNRKNLGEVKNIKLYLLKSLQRRLILELEKKQKQTKRNNDYHTEPEIVFPAEENLIRDEEEQAQLELIRQGMQQLNSKQREALYYKYTCGFSYQQICEIMSVSYDTARQLVSRAVGSLKKTLGRDFLTLFFILKKEAFLF